MLRHKYRVTLSSTVLWIGLLALGLSPFLALADQPIYTRVEIFSHDDTWESVETFVEPTSSGLQQSKSQISSRLSGNCEDLLARFQKRPLTTMKSNGYITPEMMDELMNLANRGIKPSQIVMINQYSALTEAEALALFPDSRELERRTIKKRSVQHGGKWLVQRGTLWAVRRFELDRSRPGRNFVPLKVPWELGAPPLGFEPLPGEAMKPVLDPHRLLFLYEFGRASAEGQPLPGDFKAMTAYMIQILSSEASTLGLDPEQVIVSAHALASRQARLFSLLFPLRPLNRRLAESLEQDAKGTLSHYLETPGPKGSEWDQIQDVVQFGSLAQSQKAFPVEQFSAHAKQLALVTEGRVQGRQALNLLRDYTAIFRTDYDFNHPQLGKSEFPLMIMRGNDATWISDMMMTFEKYGIPPFKMEDLKTAVPTQKLLDYLSPNFSPNPMPDMHQVNYYEKVAYLNPTYDRPDVPNFKPSRVSHLITNVDPEMVQRFPRIYLAAVILGLRDRIDFEITQLGPRAFTVLKQKLSEDRLRLKLPVTSTVDADIFFETYGLGVAAESPLIQQELQLLGGKARDVLRLSISGSMSKSGYSNLSEPVTAVMNMDVGRFFEFKTPQLKALAEMFPYLKDNARLALQPGQNKVRLKLHSSPLL